VAVHYLTTGLVSYCLSRYAVRAVKSGRFGRTGHVTLKKKARKPCPRNWDGKNCVKMDFGEALPDGSVSQHCRLMAFRIGSTEVDSLIRVMGTLNELYFRGTLIFAICEVTFHLYFILLYFKFVLCLLYFRSTYSTFKYILP
jgi:hypothetical protein